MVCSVLVLFVLVVLVRSGLFVLAVLVLVLVRVLMLAVLFELVVLGKLSLISLARSAKDLTLSRYSALPSAESLRMAAI